jgi:methyl-accepting chemotaxis protein
MKWFYNLKTSVKLISAFVLMALILGFVGLYGLNNLKQVNTKLDFMYKQRVIPVGYLTDAQVAYQRMRVNIRDMNFIAETIEQKNEKEATINDLRAQVEKNLQSYSSSYMIPEEKNLVEKFNESWKEYNSIMDHAIESAHKGDVKEYKRIAPGFKVAGDQAENVLKELVVYNAKLAEKSSLEGAELYGSSRTFTLFIIVVAVLISIGLGYFISQIISRPLNKVVTVVGKVADGDLRDTLKLETNDEIGQLAKSIDTMVLSLRKTVGGILTSAESVAAASQQISATTEEIASGSTSQANEAQVMNELFKELSTAIESVARGAEEASELSNSTVEIAEKGGTVIRSSVEGMQKVNQQMSRLEEDSNKIGEIIAVIDDIANQTNLLALNAAIEAARAGDQGRGFAVVADEVRKLAERSSEATKEITDIIKLMQHNTQTSVEAVGEGVVSSQKTGEAFEHIISKVNESANKVAEIAAASEEQAAQTAEVMNSIDSISAATQEAAASSEETASTAQSLAQLAEELNDSVSIFKIK